MNINLIKQITTLVLFVLLAWFFVHIFAVLGIFILIIYPILVLFNPSRETCLLCILRGKDDGCYICKKKSFEERPVFIKILLNIILISSTILVSIGVVYGEKFVLEKTGLLTPKKTIVMNIPIANRYKIGELFTMPIEISGIKVPINSVQVDLKYPPEILELVEILTAESFASIFIQKEIKNDLGLARISGGLPSPGFSEDTGMFVKVLFITKSPGIGEIQVLPTSMVLANDGSATNVLAEFRSSAIQVMNERISKPEEDFQKNFLETQVLGVSNDKMEFYEEDIVPLESILNRETEDKSKNSLKFADLLYTVDTKILDVINLNL
ncbi:MAG: hypothetical protein UR34_C0019G0009 [candidate division WS6 bacterium GW2011_GWC1_33_20]|uniref:Uncharacterized protein n=1 Tax=candidate division WS6 bacterium GW2011_GWC1_33_20 TaxID=1619089 RepID=A0A0G0CI74_9BACT|nr:MAG: hypothetical protein UR32_C0006G0004 [candidate division WS6 bacterium GW2011_GWE2_33_157]KKP43267.1 MAG: hypothetical protein UR34_C0019G0009 [candidate division WS6 bacterium GW2011_GWC1_33_20]KKP45701.1 MAG: hypothetical protein UR36_C0005G0037 [candidate division WS6 bacterium GW2011_GWF1_33_233]KKP53794.1 MAG: hypothetical protein UR45_C0025G0005 [candidate division WS6 bacterium GW2011_WS6_33_547]KKP56000.1 MAG: hypothetical protein UR49_C0022G0005 [candidate division WS6 bacteriu